MSAIPKDVIKELIREQNFSGTTEIMNEMFRDAPQPFSLARKKSIFSCATNMRSLSIVTIW